MKISKTMLYPKISLQISVFNHKSFEKQFQIENFLDISSVQPKIP